jgi:hypothetical protein
VKTLLLAFFNPADEPIQSSHTDRQLESVEFRSRAFSYFCVFSLALRMGCVLSAQPAPTPTFEVTSVKQNKRGSDSIQRAGLQPGDRVTITNATLWTLIQMAYPGMAEIVGAELDRRHRSEHWCGPL